MEGDERHQSRKSLWDWTWMCRELGSILTWSWSGCFSIFWSSRYSKQSWNVHHAKGLHFTGLPSSKTCTEDDLSHFWCLPLRQRHYEKLSILIRAGIAQPIRGFPMLEILLQYILQQIQARRSVAFNKPGCGPAQIHDLDVVHLSSHLPLILPKRD